MNRLWYIIPFLGAATVWLILVVYLAPPMNGTQVSLSFPNSLESLRELAKILQLYQQEHSLYVFILFCSAYLYKQSFAIPGSFLLNILAGSLYGFWYGFPLVCVLCSIGATVCYLISSICCREYVTKNYPRLLDQFVKKIQQNWYRLFYFLLFLRMMPFTPNWFINMASPIVGVPIGKFFITILLGLMPYNYMCIEAGIVLGLIHSLDEIFSWTTLARMAFMATAALLPSFLLKSQGGKSKD